MRFALSFTEQDAIFVPSEDHETESAEFVNNGGEVHIELPEETLKIS